MIVVLAASDKDKKLAWKIIMRTNTKFAWDRNSLSRADTVSDVLRFIDRVMVRESINKMSNGKAVGPSSIVSEMVKTAGVDMIIDLLNQIIFQGVIPAEWELRTFVNC